MGIQNYLTGLALAGTLAAISVRGDYFVERDRTNDINATAKIGFVTNHFKFDETVAKTEVNDKLAIWVKDHPASNVYITGHTDNAGEYTIGQAFSIPTGVNSTNVSYQNGEAGTVYVTGQKATMGVIYQPFGVLFHDESKGKDLNTKLTGENNTLGSAYSMTNQTYIYSSGSTNVSGAINQPRKNISGIYTFHLTPNGTNTITLQTHYEPRDRAQDTNAANPTLSYITNKFNLKGVDWSGMFNRGDELALLVQDTSNGTWNCVDRRVFQTTPQDGDVLTFITPQLNSTNVSGMPLERRLGLSAFSEDHGEAVIQAEGVGSSKSESTNSFVYEGHSGHSTFASNFQTTNGYVSTSDVINNAVIIPEPNSLVGGIMAVLFGYFSRKK